MAPLLSAMEGDERSKLKLHAEGTELDGVAERIPYPANLFIIGTINMDETTHGLSDKVLDRAFVLEFWRIDLDAYPHWETCGLDASGVARVRGALGRLLTVLEPGRLHFGWRVVDDVLGFLRHAGDVTDATLDAVVYAKVLPKLRGEAPSAFEPHSRQRERFSATRSFHAARQSSANSSTTSRRPARRGSGDDEHALAGLAPAWEPRCPPRGRGDGSSLGSRAGCKRADGGSDCRFWRRPSAHRGGRRAPRAHRPPPLGPWTPGFFAGEVIVRVVQPETRREATYRIDVSPDSGKLGGKLYEAMLEDLWHQVPELLLGEEPSLRAMGIEQAAENPILTYGRLRRWGGELLRSLRPLMRAPITRLTHERRRVPIHMVRRAYCHTSLALARARLMPGAERPGDPSTPLDTPAIEPSVANAANRTTLALIRRVLQAARGCVRELETRVAKEKDSATRTALSIRWPARRDFLLSLERELAKATRSAPFGALGDVESSPEGLIAAASNPIYARVHRLGWRCTARGFAGRPRPISFGFRPPGRCTSVGAGSPCVASWSPRASRRLLIRRRSQTTKVHGMACATTASGPRCCFRPRSPPGASWDTGGRAR